MTSQYNKDNPKPGDFRKCLITVSGDESTDPTLSDRTMTKCGSSSGGGGTGGGTGGGAGGEGFCAKGKVGCGDGQVCLAKKWDRKQHGWPIGDSKCKTIDPDFMAKNNINYLADTKIECTGNTDCVDKSSVAAKWLAARKGIYSGVDNDVGNVDNYSSISGLCKGGTCEYTYYGDKTHCEAQGYDSNKATCSFCTKYGENGECAPSS